MKRLMFSILLLVTILSLTGCGVSPTPVTPPEITPTTEAQTPLEETVLISDKPRQTSPSADEADIVQLVASNQDFALQLYQALRSTSGNLFYSPYSISQALAMTYAGAKGQTAEQMAKALRFSLSQEQLHPAFNALDIELAKRSEPTGENEGRSFKLNIVNAIWGQAGYAFLPEYLDVLAENYGAGLRTLDFANQPEEARMKINTWVEEQTEQRIRDLIPQGSINDLTRLVLTNAIYFKAGWLFPFDKANTQEAPFTLLDNSQVNVPMMNTGSDHSFSYAQNEDVEVIELPYEGDQISMVILMPKNGSFEGFEETLDVDLLNSLLDELSPTSVVLQMPRFKYETRVGLADALKSLGMQDAFTPGAADFSGMDGSQDLYIQDALHKAYVDVNEEGTEAAAATAIVVGVTSMPVEVIHMTVDHPFLFLIRDRETGAILFLGRVVDPRSS